MTDRQPWIAFEGPDGAGKTTLAQAFCDAHSNSVFVPSPSLGAVGEFARSTLKMGVSSVAIEARQLLFLSDILDTYFRLVVPAILDGKMVVSDRWILSTLLYNHALLEMCGAEDEAVESTQDLYSFYQTLTVGQGPDVTYIVNTPEPVRWKRLTSRDSDGDLNESSRGFQRLVAELYRDFRPGGDGFYSEGLDLRFPINGSRDSSIDSVIQQCSRDVAQLKPPPLSAYSGLWNRLSQESR